MDSMPFQQIDLPVIGKTFEIVMVLADPPVDHPNNFQFFVTEDQAEGPLIGLISGVSDHLQSFLKFVSGHMKSAIGLFGWFEKSLARVRGCLKRYMKKPECPLLCTGTNGQSGVWWRGLFSFVSGASNPMRLLHVLAKNSCNDLINETFFSNGVSFSNRNSSKKFI